MLRPGDVVFVQTLDRPQSWLIMYITQSEVSHVASYVGDRKIAHAKLGAGVVIEPVERLFVSNARILPCVWPMPDDKRMAVVEMIKEKYEGVPYGWLPALLKGLRILTGRDWPAFRWTFFLDVSLILLIFDIPFLLLLHHPVATWLVPIHLSFIAFNSALWRVRPLKFSESTAKPSDILKLLQSIGGSFILDAFAVHQQAAAESKAAATGPTRGVHP